MNWKDIRIPLFGSNPKTGSWIYELYKHHLRTVEISGFDRNRMLLDEIKTFNLN